MRAARKSGPFLSERAHAVEAHALLRSCARPGKTALRAARDYPNPYADVICWIDLAGPGFARRVYGFWDGGRAFRIRFVATAPGEWTWRAGSGCWGCGSAR